MIIGFDAKRAFFNKSGLGNYSRTLIKSICEYYPENTYELYSPIYKNENLVFPDLPKNSRVHFPGSVTGKLLSPLWRSFNVTSDISRNNTNIFHGLSNELPFNIKKSGAKTIVTIHDLIFIRFPQLYSPIDRKMYEIKFKKACKDADHIIAVSEQTKNDLITFFNIKSDKISVVYQSCDPSYFTFSENEQQFQKIKQKYNLPENYLLYIGTIEERKNLLTLLKAIKQLPVNIDIPLVVIGNKKKDYFKIIREYIKANNLEKKVIFPERVDNSELPFLYNKAKIFIYPSIFEGFGIPVLEALLCKVPVITSNCSSLPEAAGPFSELTDPTNAEELTLKIRLILSDPEKGITMVEQGLKHAQKFHPKKTSQDLMAIYKGLM
ncbi:MAG: glycosyltransferase family 4 protein [Bacteroidota bacterium]|nr:glycosyltransferase family 4 protein [Bacteroidota bacterium]